MRKVKKITGKHLLFKIDIVSMPCQLKIKYINHENYKIYIILTIYYCGGIISEHWLTDILFKIAQTNTN